MKFLKNHKKRKGNNYKVSSRTKRIASKIGLVVLPSSRKGKKLDVYDKKTGRYKASIGAEGYKDFHIYRDLESKGKIPKGTADKKRKNYEKRHGCNNAKKGSNNLLACLLLWS